MHDRNTNNQYPKMNLWSIYDLMIIWNSFITIWPSFFLSNKICPIWMSVECSLWKSNLLKLMSNKNAKFRSVKNAQIVKFGDLLCRQIMKSIYLRYDIAAPLKVTPNRCDHSIIIMTIYMYVYSNFVCILRRNYLEHIPVFRES